MSRVVYIIAIIALLVLGGCGVASTQSASSASAEEQVSERVTQVEDCGPIIGNTYYSAMIIRDRQTGVLYTVLKSTNGAVSVFPLLDSSRTVMVDAH